MKIRFRLKMKIRFRLKSVTSRKVVGKILELYGLGGRAALNVTPMTEVKNVKIFIETHPLGIKFDAEHDAAIIFTPKSSKSDEFSHF
jgi:hypothetical protein